eukprot:CAMPEP_0195521378 /NCGR_PEP_ID=MMETSP0794_2-20130614/18575_1 /TAXON_ID=515487 /ORGANISM="Stephanopyxis turris, Strain CCMP 815" /LENGTH=158 /DNA_ID=CAMNT_0040650919 /DNA_START=159 /DNA_END=632 /DNA_ORIENTATION=+
MYARPNNGIELTGTIDFGSTTSGSKNNRQCKLATGTKKVLVSRVNATDSEPEYDLSFLANSVFGSEEDVFNLKQGYGYFAQNQLNFKAATAYTNEYWEKVNIVNGAIEVAVKNTAADGMDNSIILSAVITKIAQMGITRGTDYDYLMLCIPPGANGGW